MKNPTQGHIGSLKTRLSKSFAFFGVGILVLSGILSTSLVRADNCSSVSQCTQQEQSLQQENSQNQSTINQLQVTASNYQGAINQLQSQISGLEQQIATNEATQANLQQQIAQNQTELDQQKQVLASDIRSIYMNGQMTTIEMLATSNDISQFINAETYRSAVQDKVQSTLSSITKLQAQLKQQADEVAAALASQSIQQSQLNSAESQQGTLLNLNQQQQVAYNAQIQLNQSQITALRAKIVALNMPAGSNITSEGVCGGGYPTSTPNSYGLYWGCNHPQDNTGDDWGMDNRECVSYTAFMVHEEYLAGKVAHDMPNWGAVGNAGEWISDAESAGIPVDQTPIVGDIAIRPASGITGDVGHAMYVAGVNGDGTITVWQYNENYNGEFSIETRSMAGLYFIHFSEWQ